MKTERELFEAWVKEVCPQIQWELTAKTDGDYDSGAMSWAWAAWQASAKREGYKLVQIQPSYEVICAIENKVREQLEASAIDADMFRLDGERIFEDAIGATP